MCCCWSRSPPQERQKPDPRSHPRSSSSSVDDPAGGPGSGSAHSCYPAHQQGPLCRSAPKAWTHRYFVHPTSVEGNLDASICSKTKKKIGLNILWKFFVLINPLSFLARSQMCEIHLFRWLLLSLLDDLLNGPNEEVIHVV